MKRNMLAKKLTATVLTGTMVMSMGGVTAYANGPSTAFDFTKYVTTDGNVHVPAVEFGFTATPADPAEGDSVYVVRGEDGGLSADSIDFASETTVSGDGKTISKKGQIHVKTSAFTEPGIYKYTLSENDFPVAGEGASDPYEGIVKDSTEYTLYVYMTDDDNDGTLEYKGVTTTLVTSSDKDNVAKTPTLSFTNDYGSDPETSLIHNLTVEKQVTGNQGNVNEPFEFHVTINGAEGEQYKVVVTKDGTPTTSTLATGVMGTYMLDDDDTIVIYGLSENDSYIINEENYSTDGYTTKVDGTEGREATGKMGTDDKKITFENYKNADTPTGIAMTFAPYAVMVAFAGVFAVMFLRKKREDF